MSLGLKKRMTKTKWLLQLGFVLALSAGIFGLIEPVYLTIKASVAQRLLESAWQKSRLNPLQDVKPWPWADSWPVFKLILKQSADSRGSLSYPSNSSPPKTASYIVLADASGESLAFAPGLMTSYLYPGELGNSLVAAHRDTHFAFLAHMKVGDKLEVEYKDGSRLRFNVDLLKIIDSRVESPVIDLDEARLTLVTCYPFEQSSQQTDLRLLISGKLVNEG